VASTNARTRPSIDATARSGSGTNPSSGRQGSARGAIPSMVRAMWWLKYHGAGSSTAAAGPAIAVMAIAKARLQPAVITTSAASSGAR